ncbi:MAG: flagellar export chaperone FlgN [Planctomycetaceae bacterium]|nr:flagellar export chaperone FlgN [Planctomycetaceae bacterium]
MSSNRLDSPWLDDVERFVEVLEATQQELLATLRLKRRALASADVDDLQRLNAAATEVAQRLKSLTEWRARLLVQAGQPGATLSDVLAQRAHLRPETLRGRLEAVQLRFGEARREAWVQWIVVQRAGGCYADILDLIARGGKRSPVYGDMPGGSGGAMIDTAV